RRPRRNRVCPTVRILHIQAFGGTLLENPLHLISFDLPSPLSLSFRRKKGEKIMSRPTKSLLAVSVSPKKARKKDMQEEFPNTRGGELLGLQRKRVQLIRKYYH